MAVVQNLISVCRLLVEEFGADPCLVDQVMIFIDSFDFFSKDLFSKEKVLFMYAGIQEWQII
jgi:hypothetical protein